MPMTLSGDGTITGLSAGGLPNGSIITADIADANITAAKLDGAQSGSAPIYAARAWVNFDGTGTVAIRASGNVSSITDNGTGDYTVNFTTAMPDANYAVALTVVNAGFGVPSYWINTSRAYSTTSVSVSVFESGPGSVDSPSVFVSIFR